MYIVLSMAINFTTHYIIYTNIRVKHFILHGMFDLLMYLNLPEDCVEFEITFISHYTSEHTYRR